MHDKTTFEYEKAKLKSVAFISYLVEQDIDINQKDTEGNTALDYALKHNLDTILITLLTNGAECSNVPKAKLLQLAILQNDINAFKQLIDNHASTIAKEELCDVLNSLIAKKRLDFIDVLIAKNISFNCNSSRGITPLHVAAYLNNESLVQKMLSHGAQKDKGNTKGVLPYHIAKLNNYNNLINIVKPISLNAVTSYNVAQVMAIIEAQLLQLDNPLKGYKRLKPYETYNAFNIKRFAIDNPLLNFLSLNDSLEKKYKYANALYSSSPLVINESNNSIANFKKQHNYKGFTPVEFSISLKYENNNNREVSITSKRALNGRAKEDKESTHDIPTSVGYGIEARAPNWQNTDNSYWVVAGSHIGACGGWNKDCLTVINGNCISFSDSDPRASTIDVSVRGNQTIPGIQKTNSVYHTSFPMVTIFNDKNTITLIAKQGDLTTELHAGETKIFDRQLGDIVINSSWDDHARGKGNDCNDSKKLSIYQVYYPSTADIKNFKPETSIKNRLKTYTKIAANRQWLQENAAQLESWEIYGMESLIHLQSELLKEKVKPVVKAELNGIVDFFENTDFIKLNEGLIDLAEVAQIDIPDLEAQIDELILLSTTSTLLKQELQALKVQITTLSIDDIRSKISEYKTDYLSIFNEKVDLYNLLILEYSMYIPNEKLLETLALERLPIIDKHLNNYSKEVFKR